MKCFSKSEFNFCLDATEPTVHGDQRVSLRDCQQEQVRADDEVAAAVERLEKKYVSVFAHLEFSNFNFAAVTLTWIFRVPNQRTRTVFRT